MRRKRYAIENYNKNEALKDATKYFVIYEGKKEPRYFEAFNVSFLDEKSAYVHHILEESNGVVGNTPLKLKERAKAFIDNPPKSLRITPSVDDRFRFVLDVDRHPRDHIEELKTYCEALVDGDLFISNFCFEVWLWSHINDLVEIRSTKSKEMKTELGDAKPMNFPQDFMKKDLIISAIQRCKDADINKSNYFPVEKSSKVYLLIEELMKHSFLNLDVEE